MPQYKLKDGIELHPYGETSLINNDNLTDAIAEFLIESGRATFEDFEGFDAKPELQEVQEVIEPAIEPVIEPDPVVEAQANPITQEPAIEPVKEKGKPGPKPKQ